MTREAGWRYDIISTVPYEQQKIYRKIILFQRIYYISIILTGLPCHREPSIVLMSMSHLIANNMEGKTVRIYSFSNGRRKHSYEQNFDTALYNLNIKNCF